MDLNLSDIVRMVDISCVKAENTYGDIREMASTAMQYNFLCAFTLPAHIPFIADLLKDRRDILIGGPVGFPDGGSTTSIKTATARELISMGVDELDMVINIAWLKARQYKLVEKDIADVVETAGKTPVKLILECTHLTDSEIREACRIGISSGVSYIKTGTGWAGDTTAEHVRIIADSVKNQCGIKAAGGIRTTQDIVKMHDLGVSRFGLGLNSTKSIISTLLGE